MSDKRESQVYQKTISELTALLRKYASDEHKSLGLLAVVAYYLMHSCAAKSYETKEINGEGMRFTHLFNEPQSPLFRLADGNAAALSH
ncbi:hypothetical protein ABVL33_001912 [Salmonella enterica]|nr:hypothetical protein [Salmonella enterica]EDQ3688219.1 hypothetical protein [Salmonella enterica subsp. enterica serovar Bonariensis]EDT6887230.1 hypothetical protein [Salmonella enterica subsp. enterica]MJC94301.1 hypothetical protein [Salmonella enterica subsp. enterica serovar Infantis]EAW3037975.1 hypothetical protein [Salmonella enterica]